MIAHFDWNGIAFDPNDLVFKLNGFLPRDIAVYAIREVDARAHARFSASSRTYKYFITLRKDPFLFDTEISNFLYAGYRKNELLRTNFEGIHRFYQFQQIAQPM